jgi:very-short-patch-repair endonuclease
MINFLFIKKMNKCQELATKKGGLLLSTSVTSGKKLKWQCNQGHIFYLTANKAKRGKWCLECGASIGERNIRMILQELNIPFVQQCVLPILPRRKYDFCFRYNDKHYLIEFDGEQHFQFVKRYHKTKTKFTECQVIDRIKTYCSWRSGYHLIRIDYTQIDNAKYHIINAIQLGHIVYLSDPKLYKYITDVNLTPEQIQKYT